MKELESVLSQRKIVISDNNLANDVVITFTFDPCNTLKEITKPFEDKGFQLKKPNDRRFIFQTSESGFKSREIVDALNKDFKEILESSTVEEFNIELDLK